MMIRSGTVLAVLLALALGPIYAGADSRMTVDPASRESRIAALRRSDSPTRPRRPRAPTPVEPERIVRRVDVERGDTLASLLADAGLDAAAIARWSKAIAEVLDPRHIRIGRALTIEHDASGALAVLRYEVDALTSVVVERTGDALAARRETRPTEVEVRGVTGIVERGLWRDVVAAGAPPAVASSLTTIFGGTVDFKRVAPGDEFRVLYEMRTDPESGVEKPGVVLGATVEVRGRTKAAIRFEDRTGRARYFAPDGTALGASGMLRYPLQFRRISSGFTHRRYHPILRRTRPHLGVDFAAPRGTPVRATADGTVVSAGWKRGMGRTVRLRHGKDLETFYGHLHRIAPSLRTGRPVRQGEVIGYVGATGLATGNHLHYGVRRGGRFVNPLAVGEVRLAALPDAERPAFESVRDTVATELARLADGSAPQVVSFAPLSGAEG